MDDVVLFEEQQSFKNLNGQSTELGFIEIPIRFEVSYEITIGEVFR